MPRPESLPVVLLGGPEEPSDLWRDVAQDLRRGHRCLTAALIGRGASERPAGRRAYTIDAQAEGLRGVLDEFGAAGVALVAGGMAGAVAITFAARHPERVRALILVGTVLHADSWPPDDVLPLLPRGMGEAVLALQRHGKDDGRSLLRVFRGLDLGFGSGTVADALAIVAVAPPPTLVLWGEQDTRLSPSYGRRVARALDAAWRPVPDAGHQPAGQHPERVAEEINRFLAEVVHSG